MGPQEDYIETVVTCEGDFHDPQLQDRLQRFQRRLESLLIEDGKNQLVLKKVEPWNSVRVTFNIPREAALRLKQLAEQGNASLRQMGVLGVQIEGDRLVSLTVATPNNQRAELIIRTHDASGQAAAAGASQVAPAGASVSFDPGLPSSSDEPGSPGPSMEVTRKNIEEYLRQGSLFSSILPPSSGAGPSGAGPSSDLFKAPSADGGPYRANNIASDAMPGPSGQSGFPPRTAFSSLGGHGSGAFTPPGVSVGGPAPGHRGPRTGPPHHPAQQLQQQMPSQATALPQTAALGYNMMGLPPPPPYPHGHGGVVNNRQGKKMPASSPLLINLLQTDPVAAANSVMGTSGSEKPKKKRRRKNKQVTATATSDGLVNTPDMHSLPSDSNSASNIVPPQTMPSAEEMSAVLHRQVSPVPLPSPRLSVGFSSALPSSSEHGIGNEGFRDRKPSTASAALATLAQSQRSSVEGDHFSGDSIINPYTGHMEPRDSASDLSPVKKDQHKARSHSLTESSVSAPHPPPPVSVSAARVDVRTGSGDSLHVGLGSYHQGAAVPSALREEPVGRGFPFPPSVSQPVQTHSASSDSVLVQRPDVVNVTTTPSSAPVAAAPQIYAQHPFGPSQPSTRTSQTTPASQHSSAFPVATANGPVPATSPPSAHTVSTNSQALAGQNSRLVPALESGGSNLYHMPPHSHRSPGSVRSEVVHNVPVSSEAVSGVGGQMVSDVSAHQPRTMAGSQPVTHKAAPVADVRHGAPPPTTASAHVQSDSLKLLNSSSSSPAVGAVQRMSTETATTTSTASPAGSKPPSDGDDNSNHSNVSPGGQADPTTAPSSLLDANGTKVDNHDSGVGSSSERSEDTTPSEAGDGEFQTSVATVEVSATDSSGSKVSVGVSKAVVNCKKEASGGGSDPHTITVGYVQMNQHAADLFKDSKKHIADSMPLIGDKSSAEDSMRQVSNLIKSTAGLAPAAGQIALAAHKDMSVSLSMAAKVTSAQQQQLMIKKKAAQVPGVYQNGPQSVPHGVRHPHPPRLRLPNHSQTTVHHSTGITISHSQGHLGVPHPTTIPPSTQPVHRVPLNQGPNHQPGSVATSQPLSHLPASVATSQPLHHLPARVAGGQHLPGNVATSQHLPGNVATSQPIQHMPGSVACSHPVPHVPGNVVTSQPQQHVPGSVATSQPLQHVPGSVATSQPLQHVPGSVATGQLLQRQPGGATTQHPAASVATSQALQNLSGGVVTSQPLHHTGNSGMSNMHDSPVSMASTLASHQPPRSLAGSEGVQHMPVSVRDSQVSHLSASVTTGSPTVQHPPRSVATSQANRPLTPSSLPGGMGQGQFQHSAAASLSVAPPHAGGAGHGVTSADSVISCTAIHSASVTSLPSVSMGLSDRQGQRTMGPCPVSQGTAGGLVAHSTAVIFHSQGNGPTVSSTAPAMQHMGLPPHPHLQARTPSPNQHPSLHTNPTNGPSLPNAVGNRLAGEKVPKTVPSPLVSTAPTVPDSSSTTELATFAVSLAHSHNDKGLVGQPTISTPKAVVEKSVPSSVSMEGTVKGYMTSTTVSSTLGTAEDVTTHLPKQGSPRLATSNPSSVIISLNKTNSSVTSDLVSAGAVSDLDLIDASYPNNDDVFDEDLALVSEPGLSALLEAGIRHGAANGSGGLGTEARGGSNITSMYNKRSSPINVNMLNHMYAAGLPQPRRLTESVQRLVKPLPNPENSLPPGRACKSPGASSRHSSNGSTSPGRAAQGGARSPGANVSSASVSRNLPFDKLSSNSSSAVNSVGMGSGYPPAYHTAQPSVTGALVNCINTSVIPAAPHPLATLQSTAGSRGKGGNGPAALSASSVGQQNCVVASSTGGSAVFTSIPSASASSSFSSSSSSSSAVPTLLTVTPQPVPDAVDSSHQEGVTFPHDSLQAQMQLPALNHSTSSPSFPTSLTHTTAPHMPSVHPPLPALVHLDASQQSPCVNRVSGAAIPATISMPGVVTTVSTVYSHVPTNVRLSHPPLTPQPQRPVVSVCNMSTRVHPVPFSGLSLPSSSSTTPPASSSVSIPSAVLTPTVSRQQSSANVPPSTCSFVSTTGLSSSLDLSKHRTVTSAGQALASSAMGSVHVASASRGATGSHPVVASKPVTMATENQGTVLLAVSSSDGSTIQRNMKVEASADAAVVKYESGMTNKTEARTERSAVPAPHSHTVLPSVSSDSLTSVTGGSGAAQVLRTVVSRGAQNETAVPSTSGHDMPRNSLSQNQPKGYSVPKAECVTQSLSQSPVVKESAGKEEGSSKSAASSMPPLSHHSMQDSSAHMDSLHSKPPLLQPTPPLILPTPLSSATPPPPPLTPVLLQAPNPGHSTPPLSSSTEGQGELTPVFHLRDVPRTASPLSLAPEPAAAITTATEPAEETSGISEHESVEVRNKVKTDTTSGKDAASVQPSSDKDQPKASNEPSTGDPSQEDGNLKTRRFTRKRKSTYSESDSSSEPAPKLSCVDGAVGYSSKGVESKSASGSDHPPKLQKEGKRSSGADKKEEEKGNKKEEEKGGRKGEEKPVKKEDDKTGRKDEVKAGKKEEEKGEKKEEDKGGRKEEEKGGVGKKEDDKGNNKNAGHDKNILEATPEEIARRMAAATTGGKRRVHYAYVPEKSLNQSYFDTPVLSGRTRSQGTRGHKEGSSSASGSSAGAASSNSASSSQTAAASATATKEDGGETTATAGSKRSTRSLRTKDTGDSSQSKRKRVKDHR